MDTDMVTAMLVTDTDIILVMDMVMVTVMVTAMDTDIILERGPLMPSPLLMPNPLLPLSPDMLMAVMVSVMLTVMVMLMDTDTPMLMLDTITAKDLLSPPLLLNLDTVMLTDTDMVTVMVTDTDTPMLDILVTITAKGLLKPSPIMVTVMLLMPTMVTVMAVTVMVTVTLMLMASKFILLSFLSNYYNGCVYKKFYNLESFDLRSTVPEVQPLAYKKEALVMLSVILCRV